ncbi:hypothetical protein LU604_16040 [Erwinia tracheiphila]|uniref:Uncharacterized protein n=1 Tax=Erwinia tracheiphila TaxID=65700 RepID=A0A345CPF5_9GAMM|nr:hypothetical protein [Erwinia tracheiphila]AXF75322.1 hypothetical protein AV903_03140 [Erwinia tracheiphila]UIA82133.1 hypothetical protein LU604_16040 [Erwinia tracheiphila]UIA90727.1 hypothetical protein LU632_15595 [Erwinia tracheiphila]
MFTHLIEEDAIDRLNRASAAASLLSNLMTSYDEYSGDALPASSVATLIDYINADISVALKGCEMLQGGAPVEPLRSVR